MSYDIRLTDPATGDTLELDAPHQIAGGTYVEGGTREAWLSVTYNYSPHFYRVLGPDGIRSIYGKGGRETIPLLLNAAAGLGDDVADNYWAPTEGNAKQALLNLASLAALAPDGVWQGD